MKSIAQRRARVTRVREVQHLHAADEATIAQNKVVQLEANAARLVALRMSLTLAPGLTSGAALGNAGEMALRLDTVRHGLSDAIGAARAVAVAREQGGEHPPSVPGGGAAWLTLLPSRLRRPRAWRLFVRLQRTRPWLSPRPAPP
jgi:hypothetical protein